MDLEGSEIKDVYTVSEWKTKKGNTPDEDTHTANISFVKDGNYTFDISYTDDADNEVTDVNYGNSSYYKKFTVDTVSPFVTISVDTDPNSYGLYGSSYLESGIDVTITAAENEPYSGIKSIEYWLEDGKKEPKHEVIYTFKNNNPTHEELERTIKEQTNLNGDVLKEYNSCDTVLWVKSVDNAGNSNTSSVPLDIDVTKPSIKVVFSGTKNDNAIDGYYTSRTAVITITERTNHFKSDNVKFTINAVDLEGSEIKDVYTVSEWKTKKGNTPDEDTHTANISFVKEGNYTFDISYIDDADNSNNEVVYGEAINDYEIVYDKSVNHNVFTVDKTSPEGEILAHSAEGRTETWKSLVNPLTFGFWSRSNITITRNKKIQYLL